MAYAWKSSDEKTKLNEIETEKDTKSIEINKDKIYILYFNFAYDDMGKVNVILT